MRDDMVDRVMDDAMTLHHYFFEKANNRWGRLAGLQRPTEGEGAMPAPRCGESFPALGRMLATGGTRQRL